MIKEFIERFEARNESLRKHFSKKHPGEYKDIVTSVVRAISSGKDERGWPDPDRVHEINDGDYQGTLVFAIAEKGYQPHAYWYVFVDYGSCGGCDTLQGIRDYSNDQTPTKEQVDDYMTLALHIVQGMKKM